MLPLKQAIDKLTFHQGKHDTQIDTQTSVKRGQNVSSRVTLGLQGGDDKNPIIRPINIENSSENQFADEERGWCALQDLNLRPLPCEGNALPLS